MLDAAPYRAGFSIPDRLRADRLTFDEGSVTVHASTRDAAARCPLSAGGVLAGYTAATPAPWPI